MLKCAGVAAQSPQPAQACTQVAGVPPPWAAGTRWRPCPPRPAAVRGALTWPRTPPPRPTPPPQPVTPPQREVRDLLPPPPLLTQPAARRLACPTQPADAARCAPHAWSADMQSRRDSHRAPPKRPVSLKIGPQIKSNQIKSNQIKSNQIKSQGGEGCLGAWGYIGMYAMIAISCLCQEESLKGLKD